MKAWLKWGVLFSLLSIIITLPVLIFFETTFEEILVVSAPTYFIFIFQFMRSNPPTRFELFYVYSIIIITSAFFWFCVGALIGYLVGKFRKKSQVSQPQNIKGGNVIRR